MRAPRLPLLSLSIACLLLAAAAQAGDAADPGVAPTDPKEQLQRGLALARGGDGVAPDPAAALHWFRLAAEQGNAAAQLQLALAYQLGRGTDKDILESNRWLEKAAEQDQPRAQLELAIVHRDGMGVPVDPVKALMWALLSAQGGGLAAKAMLPGMLRAVPPAKRAEARMLASQWREAHHLPPAPAEPVRMQVELMGRGAPGGKSGPPAPAPAPGNGPAAPRPGEG